MHYKFLIPVFGSTLHYNHLSEHTNSNGRYVPKTGLKAVYILFKKDNEVYLKVNKEHHKTFLPQIHRFRNKSYPISIATFKITANSLFKSAIIYTIYVLCMYTVEFSR